MGSNHHRRNHPSTTTFIHADPSNVKAIVQYLTGQPTTTTPPPPPPQNQSFFLPPPPAKLNHQNTLPPLTKSDLIKYHMNAFGDSCSSSYPNNIIYFPVLLSSASLLDTIIGRPVTFADTPIRTTSSPAWVALEEERAIAEKGFYLHPRVMKAGRIRGECDQPRLLPLFSLHSGFAAPTHHHRA